MGIWNKIPIGYKLLVALLFVIAVAVWWSWFIEKVRSDGYNRCVLEQKAKEGDTAKRSLAVAAKDAKTEIEVIDWGQSLTNNTRVQYRTVTKEVIKYVPNSPLCNLSPDGVRLVNGALRAATEYRESDLSASPVPGPASGTHGVVGGVLGVTDGDSRPLQGAVYKDRGDQTLQLKIDSQPKWAFH